MSTSTNKGSLENASSVLQPDAQVKNQYGFTSGVDSSASPNDLAGLSGLQSGMNLPSQSGAVGDNSYAFKMPDISSSGLNNFAAAASQIKPTAQQQQQPMLRAGGVRLPAKDFESGTIGPMVSGSQNGTTLLKLLQAAGQLK
jgi:hypothetical protein